MLRQDGTQQIAHAKYYSLPIETPRAFVELQLHAVEKRVKAPAKVRSTETPEAQIASFVAKFTPEMASKILSLRAALRNQFPTAWELVYDNYNFLVFGFCTTPRSSDCIVSLAANSKGAVLSFYYGTSVPDPHNLLLGSGNQNRFIRLESTATLEIPEVRDLIAAATAHARTPLPAHGTGATVIQSISAKQRPRR